MHKRPTLILKTCCTRLRFFFYCLFCHFSLVNNTLGHFSSFVFSCFVLIFFFFLVFCPFLSHLVCCQCFFYFCDHFFSIFLLFFCFVWGTFLFFVLCLVIFLWFFPCTSTNEGTDEPVLSRRTSWSLSRPLLIAPSCVVCAGNTMTVSYMTGLMLGSAVAYAAYSFTAPGSGVRLATPHALNATGF